jgi:hypothetical protein
LRNKTTWNLGNYSTVPMKEQMKEEGVTSDIDRELYGMCTGENEKMIGELMVVEKLCCNQGNLSIYSLIKHQ